MKKYTVDTYLDKRDKRASSIKKKKERSKMKSIKRCKRSLIQQQDTIFEDTAFENIAFESNLQ